MLQFFTEQAGTILVSAILLAAVVAIVRNMVKRAKRGQCVSCEDCGKTCGGCPRSGQIAVNHRSTGDS